MSNRSDRDRLVPAPPFEHCFAIRRPEQSLSATSLFPRFSHPLLVFFYSVCAEKTFKTAIARIYGQIFFVSSPEKRRKRRWLFPPLYLAPYFMISLPVENDGGHTSARLVRLLVFHLFPLVPILFFFFDVPVVGPARPDVKHPLPSLGFFLDRLPVKILNLR